MKRLSLSIVLTSIGVLSLSAGCGDTSDPGSSQHPVCTTSTDCTGNTVCVKLGGTSTCQLTCTASANECGGQATCSGIGAVVKFCDERPAPSPQNPPKAEEQPRLPCKTDADCKVVAANAICASWEGIKDCTIPCKDSVLCNGPGVAGMKIEFLACQTDESQPSRKACLPRKECFADVMKCITMPNGMPDGGMGMPDFSTPDFF